MKKSFKVLLIVILIMIVIAVSTFFIMRYVFFRNLYCDYDGYVVTLYCKASKSQCRWDSHSDPNFPLSSMLNNLTEIYNRSIPDTTTNCTVCDKCVNDADEDQCK